MLHAIDDVRKKENIRDGKASTYETTELGSHRGAQVDDAVDDEEEDWADAVLCEGGGEGVVGVVAVRRRGKEWGLVLEGNGRRGGGFTCRCGRRRQSSWSRCTGTVRTHSHMTCGPTQVPR